MITDNIGMKSKVNPVVSIRVTIAPYVWGAGILPLRTSPTTDTAVKEFPHFGGDFFGLRDECSVDFEATQVSFRDVIEMHPQDFGIIHQGHGFLHVALDPFRRADLAE